MWLTRLREWLLSLLWPLEEGSSAGCGRIPDFRYPSHRKMELQPSPSAEALYPRVGIDGQAVQDWRDTFGDRSLLVLADDWAAPVYEIQVVVQLEGEFVRGAPVYWAGEWRQAGAVTVSSGELGRQTARIRCWTLVWSEFSGVSLMPARIGFRST